MPKPTLIEITDDVAPIAKPAGFDLNKFKSKRAATVANVGTLQTALPVGKISDAKDFVRLHPDEGEYWTGELCFVSVPIKGQKRDNLHLIDEDIAMTHLSSGQILRFRLALATKPSDVFFLARVPSQNLDNIWHETNLKGCELSKTNWVELVSRKDQNVDGYEVKFARDEDAFPEPNWPTQSLAKLIEVTFEGRMIDREDHPALLRLIGAKQQLS